MDLQPIHEGGDAPKKFNIFLNIPTQRRNNSISHDEEAIKKEEDALNDVKHFCIDEPTQRFLDEILVVKQTLDNDKTDIICFFNGCDREFPKYSKLRQHIGAHLSVRVHTCTYDGCNKSFKMP